MGPERAVKQAPAKDLRGKEGKEGGGGGGGRQKNSSLGKQEGHLVSFHAGPWEEKKKKGRIRITGKKKKKTSNDSFPKGERTKAR